MGGPEIKGGAWLPPLSIGLLAPLFAAGLARFNYN